MPAPTHLPDRVATPPAAPDTAPKLTANVGLRLTPAEAEELTREARALGLRPAQYARVLVVGVLRAAA